MATQENLDIGRPLLAQDIVDTQTHPIREDSGKVYCYACQKNAHFSDLKPLTSSSGVFSTAVQCENDAPVWLCFEHIPYDRTLFDMFTPEVQELLYAELKKQQNGDKAGV